MARHLRDPKGYYATLGVPHTADAAAVKAAYRKLAKVLHPDHNKSPNAQVDFQRLSEAYQILSDEQKRRRYDAMGARLAAATAAHPSSGASSGAGSAGAAAPGQGGTERTRSAPPPPPPRQQGTARSGASAYGQAAAYATRPRTAARSARGPFDPPQACQCCGKVTAQPRYVVFPTVRGRLFKSVRSTVEGILCRQCADRIALKAAWKNWLLGWWSLPWGPFHTISALATIARGGFYPRDRNFALLLKQSRAFLMRNDAAVAHGLAVQARGYADGPNEKALADGLIKAAPAPQGKALRNKWSEGSWLRAMQAVPLMLACGLVLLAVNQWTTVTLWGPRSAPVVTEALMTPPALQPPSALQQSLLVEGLDRPLLLRTGRLYEVTAPLLPLRTGPGTSYTTLSKLEAGTTVLVTENAPEGGWVRVLTAEGQSGFVAGRYLTPGLAGRGLDDSLTPPAATTEPARKEPVTPVPRPAPTGPPTSLLPAAPPPAASPAPDKGSDASHVAPAPRPSAPVRVTPPQVISPQASTETAAPVNTPLPSVLSPSPVGSDGSRKSGAVLPVAEDDGEASLNGLGNPGSIGVFTPISPGSRN